MGWNPVNDVKKYLGQAKREINGVASSARKGIEKTANSAKYKVEYAANQARHQVEDIGNDMVHDIKEEGEKVIDRIGDDAEEIVKQALSEIMEIAAGETFNKAVDIAQVLAPDSMSLTIGPITLYVGDIKNKIDTLQKWASNPPSSKDDIKEVITTLAPSEVSVEIDLQFAAIFLASDSLAVGFSASWSTESFLQKYDDIVAHF